MATIRPAAPPGASGFLKRLVTLAAIALVLFVVTSACMTRIDAAHVGIRVNLAGSSRGVDDIPVVTGWVLYNPLTEQIVKFPTNVQSVVWTADPKEGAAHDESITFSSQEGVNINADIGLSFHIESAMAPHLYLRFRKNDLAELSNGYIRNAVRESFNLVASTMQVQAIYGAEKGRLLADVQKKLQEELGKDGILIDQLTINGALRLPENVANAINRAMEATQLAIQAENKVRQVRAEAEQALTLAEGQAEAARARARGEADARLITAKAEAKSNLILRYSTSPTVLQYRALEKWNGKLPAMNSGPIPMLTIDASKLDKQDSDMDAKLEQLLHEDDAPAADKDAPAGGKAPAAPAPKKP
jgi:regulator of protease activity HflC (stomatin/prohibitin superfamily)